MAPAARYESDAVSAAPLGKPLEFAFSGKTAPNRLSDFTRNIEFNEHEVNSILVSKPL